MQNAAPRYHALDGLRGIAALIVVFYHIGWTNHLTNYRFFRNGYLAVDLFFILSGLVIASNYAARIRTTANVIAFLRLRFFRLYPLHAVVLAAFVLLEIVKLIALRNFGVAPGVDAPFSGQNSLAALLANVFLIQSWHLFPSYSYNGPSWSISCEFAAYLFFGWIARLGLLRQHLLYAVGLCLSFACYALLADIFHAPAAAMQWGVPRAIAGFFLGIIIWRYWPSLANHAPAFVRSATQLVLVGIVFAILASLTGARAVWVIPFFAALIGALQSDNGIVARLLLAKPVQLLGRWSYSIYMVHSLVLIGLGIVTKRVFRWTIAAADAPAGSDTPLNVWAGDALLIGVVVLILLLGAMSFRLIEEPGRLYGRRTARFS